MKNIQKLAFLATLIGGSAFADAPNPVHGFTYHRGMVLIKLGEEKGREILKTPENQQVCIGKHNDRFRFGYVDGSNCMFGAWGAQSKSLNSGDAFLVHVPEKGNWVPANDVANDKADFYMLSTGADKATSPGFVKGLPAGSFYPSYSFNGMWYAQNGQEKNNMDKNQIQVFVPNALPNPIYGIGYNSGMNLLRQGKENGKKVLQTPEGQKVCFAKYNEYMRFGHVDGSNCMITYGGSRPISLSTMEAFLVEDIPGEWISANDMAKLGASSYMLTSGPDKASSPAFIKGNPAGTFYAPFSHNGLWYSQNGQEKNNGDKNQILVFKPARDLAKDFGVNKLFTLVAEGQQTGKESQLLRDPAGNLVCAYDFDPSVFGAGQRQFVIGNVKDGKCRFEAWGFRNPEMKAGGYYVIANGDWKKRSDVSDADMVDKALVVKKGLSTASMGIGSVKGFAGKMAGDEWKYAIWYVNAAGKNVDGVQPTDPEHMVFVAKEGVPEVKPFVPYPVKAFNINSKINLVKEGDQAGKEAQLVKDPAGNFVCAYDFDPAIFGAGERQLTFGYVKDSKCIFEAWGKREPLMKDGGYYVQATGSWKNKSEVSDNDLVEKSIFVKKGLLTKYSTGIGSMNGLAGKIHGDEFQYKLWYVKADGGIQGDVSPSDPNYKLFVAGDAPAAPAPAAAPTPVAAPAATGPVPNPIYDMSYEGTVITLIRQGQESGKEILVDPNNNKVCIARFRPADFGNQGQDRLNFGYVDDKGNCRIGSFGGRSISLSSDKAFLVHVPKGGKWVDLTSAGNLIDLALSQKAKNDGTTQVIGYSKVAKTTMTVNPAAKAGWFAEKGTDKELSENNAANIQVFVPNKDVPAAAPAPATGPVANPLFNIAYKDVEFLRPGQEGGKAIVTVPGTENKSCVMVNKQGSTKGLPGDSQMMFGHAKQENGKWMCYAAGWEGWKGYSFEQYSDAIFLVHAPKGGSWKKASELKDEDYVKVNIALKSTGPENGFNTGIAALNGIPAKYHTDSGVRGLYGDKGKVTNNDQMMVFLPGEAPAAAPTPTPVTAPTPTPVSAAPVAPAPVASAPVAAPMAVAAPVEAPKPAEITAVAAVTPAPAPTPAPTVASAATPTPVVDTPKPEATPTPVNTSTDMIAQIQQGQVVVEDPDLVKKLEQQQTVPLDGEPFRWVDYGKGFALTPVSVSPTSGVVCRLIINDKAYVGNVYKNNRTLVKDATVGDVKVGDFICRAGTDLEGNKVYASTTFQTLGSRGDTPLWGPIVNSLPAMWETGYKNVIAGTQVTEGGKQITVPGICRARKEESDATKFHVGRAVMDANNKPHCYIKAKGVETDLVGDYLNTVEVLFRPTLEGATPTSVGAVVAPTPTALPK